MENKQKKKQEAQKEQGYRERIIKMVKEIENQALLIKIFIFIKTWLEE